MSTFVRNLIIGKKNYIESWCTFKQVMLSGQFALISIALLVGYIGLEFLWAETHIENIVIYLSAIATISISLYLHRKGEHCSANYFLFPTLSILIFLFAASEPPGTGALILFIPCVIGAFSVFDFKQRLFAVFYGIFTYLLFMLAYFGKVSILPYRHYAEDELLFNLIINFSFAFPSSITAVYLLIRLNHYNALQLVENNKLLTKINQELDRFVYSTSHDLRAPMASILGLIDLAARDDNPSDTTKYLTMMKGRVHALDKFVKDITDYSRNNRVPIEKRTVNLAETAQEIWEALCYAPEARKIIFENNLPSNIKIITDPTRLRMVLTNLISNAIRYHDTRKTDQFIKLNYRTVGNSFCISVEDNGLGIEPQHQNKIFEMFFRGNENSTGSGLGLYIVKETCQKLSGSIQLQSAPLVGSTFTIKLPVQSGNF